MTDDKPRNIRQAEALRQLADAIEQNPHFGDQLTFALSSMDNYLLSDEANVRDELRTFHNVTKAAGANVTIKNSRDRCEIFANFGPLVVSLSAGAALMAGEKPNTITYEPLVIED